MHMFFFLFDSVTGPGAEEDSAAGKSHFKQFKSTKNLALMITSF